MSDVVILTGLADSRWTWRPVETALADAGTVLIADRIRHQTFPTLADEIVRVRDLVVGHRVGPPVVVAHSFGALIAEAYARRYPVAGLVLVDPSWDPDATGRGAVGAGLARAVFHGTGALGKALDATGLARHLGPAVWSLSLRSVALRRPGAGVVAASRSVYRRGETLVAAAAEELAFRDFAAALAKSRATTPAPEVPVVVLTAVGTDPKSRDSRYWIAAHRRLAALFPRGRHEIVRGAKHMMHIDRPEVIVREVNRLLAA